MIESQVLEHFERGLDPARPEAGPVPAKVLGYGEMSTVISLDVPEYEGIALKRMALFHDDDEVRGFEAAYRAYMGALTDRGIRLPDHDMATVSSVDRDLITIYLTQTRLDSASIANNLMHSLRPDDALDLLRCILDESAKVFRVNADGGEIALGLDAQISNWALVDEELVYFDVSTPLIRVDAEEQLDPELFLRICPVYLVWIVRWLFLEDVINRYYDFRLVAVDILANLVKERLEFLIDPGRRLVNEFLAGERYLAPFEPITEKEIRDYYRQDTVIWRLFLALRRLERFTRIRVQRKPYDMILPGRIRR